MKIPLLTLFFSTFIFVQSVVSQVNTGREYGNPKVLLITSHLSKANRELLLRPNMPYHNFINKVICFELKCRTIIGRRKSLKSISFDEFKRRIERNAKKGMYKDMFKKPQSTYKKPQPDTTSIKRKVTEPLVLGEPAPSVAAPVLKSDSLIVLSELLFETNSFKLRGEHFSALDSIAKFLQDHPSLVAMISGHTDDKGTESYNLILSSKRAAVVAAYLIQNGASDGRVSSDGFGSAKPIMANDTESGRRKNRRVEILIHEKL